MKAILDIRDIGKSFNGLHVLQNVTFSLLRGSISALFGSNGSGKTSLAHIICGFLKADNGKIFYKGNDLFGKSPVEISRLGIGKIWQTPRICKNLTLMDNLMLSLRDHPGEHFMNYLVRPRQIRREEKARKSKSELIAVDIGLKEELQRTAGSLSFGQQKILSIGMMLLNNAELLILDEPFSGINAQMIDHMSKIFLELKQKGKTILIIEHNQVKTKNISDRIFTLVQGEINEDAYNVK